MGKPSRGGKRGGRGRGTAKGKLVIGDGTQIEFDGELQFDGDDAALTGTARTNIENWEAKRRKAKIEFAYAVTQDGEQIDRERRGGSGSVRASFAMHDTEGAIFTHNHPREGDILGGTFSGADLRNFALYKNVTARATAKEGTYSISKTANFDRKGFLQMIRDANNEFDKHIGSDYAKIKTSYHKNEITYDDMRKQYAKAFNTALVKLHNSYRDNQKKYGYTYTLEKNK